jgi:type II secretory pathway pseudopilin PulG
MPIPEPILSAIVEAIFGYVLEQSGSADWLREKLGRDPAKRAYARALDSAIDEFRGQHPEAEEQLFDESFLQREAAPILAQFLLRDGRPSPNALANAWADSLRIRDPDWSPPIFSTCLDTSSRLSVISTTSTIAAPEKPRSTTWPRSVKNSRRSGPRPTRATSTCTG